MIFYRYNSKFIPTLLLCATLLTGCTQGITANDPQQTTAIAPKDISAEYDASAATHITFGESISVSGKGAELQKNVITIFKEGTYIFEGSLQDGQIIVNAEDADVRIVLNNTQITCSYSAALYVKNAARVTVVLAEGTQNALSDMNSRPADDSIDGAVYSKAPLAITGSGSLAVNGTYKHGISSKGAVTICGGNIALSALKTGLDSRGDITLSSCTLKVDAGTNGIRSGREDEPANISILGGTHAISSAGDGIQAYGDIDIFEGDIAVTTGGGSGEAPVKYSEFSMNGRGFQSSETDDDTSRKGIKAAGNISISGGSCKVDAYDDGIHADGDISVSNGTHTASSGDDGLHAEGAVTISGGRMDIPYCYEGIEGKSVTITDGTITVSANDDGINTAANEDETDTAQQTPQMPENFIPSQGMERPDGFTPPEDANIPENILPPEYGTAPENTSVPSLSPDINQNADTPGKRPSGGKGNRGDKPGGFGGMGGETAQEGVDITISGGTVTLSAEGDCMDSNGSIYITGGTVYVSANRYPVISTAEAGLDCNGSLTVSGGSLIGTGTSASQTSGLEDAAIVYYGDSAFDANTILNLSDFAGNTLFEFTSAHDFNSVLIASPSLVVGETYVLTIGDTSEEIQLTEQLLTIGESSGGFGGIGGMGGFGGGHNMPAPFTPPGTDSSSADNTLSAS